MINNTESPEGRRLMILSGINQDHTNKEIADDIGVRVWTVINDLRVMKYNKDPELKQAYIDQEAREHILTNLKKNLGDERFHHMTGKTFQEKNFENMINYYRVELQKIKRVQDERTAIMGLSKNIRKTLKRNDILIGHGNRERLSDKARDYLLIGTR